MIRGDIGRDLRLACTLLQETPPPGSTIRQELRDVFLFSDRLSPPRSVPFLLARSVAFQGLSFFGLLWLFFVAAVLQGEF
jgi:hypothetical protein